MHILRVSTRAASARGAFESKKAKGEAIKPKPLAAVADTFLVYAPEALENRYDKLGRLLFFKRKHG